MKRYIMRAPASPFENPTHRLALEKDLMSSNSGNLLFVHSIARALMTEDTQIDFAKTIDILKISEEENLDEKYDAFIIPLANAFRTSALNDMKRLIKIIESVDMPCIVIGVGYQHKLKDDLFDDEELNQISRTFCEAVLKKSSSIGIRGEYTAKYLENLGFVRDKDFRIIGCPSMYLYGENLPAQKELHLSKETKVNINCKISLSRKAHKFIHKVCDEFDDHVYIPQNTYELETLFCGRNVFDGAYVNKTSPYYPVDYDAPIYRQNKIRGFVNVEAWLDFLKERDLNIGTRIHGNIAGILSGLPSFIVAPDIRVLELAEFHQIPHITLSEVNQDTIIRDVLEAADFSTIHKGHRERFRNYMDFLHENSLTTIYDKKSSVVPFDEKIKAINFHGPIVPLPFATYDETMEASKYWQYLLDKEKKKVRDLKKQVKDSKKKTLRSRLKFWKSK